MMNPLRHVRTLAAAAVLSAFQPVAGMAQGPQTGSADANAAREGSLCPVFDAEKAEASIGGALIRGPEDAFYRVGRDIREYLLEPPQTISYLSDINDVLAEQGIKLILVPIPPKATIDMRWLPKDIGKSQLFDPDVAVATYRTLVADLRAAGIETVDVRAVADESKPFFFLRDFHWRPESARDIAERIAEIVRKDERYDALPRKVFTTSLIDPDWRLPTEMERIVAEACGTSAVIETMAKYQTEEQADDLDGFLAAETSAPVAVVGTSFSDELTSFNFTGFLREVTQLEVAGYALSGGGLISSIMDWSHNAGATRQGTRFLVWEVPLTDSLASVPDVDFRQIIPALRGECGEEDVIVRADYELKDGAPLVLDGLPAEETKEALYIHLTLSDPTVRIFNLDLTYRDGREEKVSIARPERVQKFDGLFYEISEPVAPLSKMAVSTKADRTVSGTATLCTTSS